MCMRTFVCANSVRSWRKTKTAREHYRTIFALIGQSKVSRQTFLMPNRRKSQLDVFRTQTWARFCAVALNLRKGSDLERKMLEVEAAGEPLANCHDPCGSPWMMEDTRGVRASAGRGRSIL